MSPKELTALVAITLLGLSAAMLACFVAWEGLASISSIGVTTDYADTFMTLAGWCFTAGITIGVVHRMIPDRRRR